MMRKEYMEEFVRAAKAQGVEHLRFYVEESAGRSVTVCGGQMEHLDLSESCQIFAEGAVEGFAGSVFVEDLRPEHIEEHVQTLRECALEAKRPFLELPLPALPAPEGLPADFAPLEEVVERLVAAGEAAQAVDSRVSVQSCSFHERRGTVTLADSQGNAATDWQGGGHLYIGLTARQGETAQQGGRGLHLPWGPLPELEALAREAAAEAVSRLDAASYPTGHSGVVLTGKVVCELLDAFAPAFFARSVERHMSVLEGRLGQPVAGENITLREEPQLSGGLRCRRFDDEGTLTAAKAVLDRGVLQTYLHNAATAGRAGTASGGNGFRPSFSAEVSTGYTNLVLSAGEKSLEELLEELGEGLLITGVSGVFAGARPTTGEFSLIAQGFRVQGGQQGRAVSKITIAGDFFEMLRQVRGIGNDARWMRAANGCVCAPPLLVESLAVSGGDAK